MSTIQSDVEQRDNAVQQSPYVCNVCHRSFTTDRGFKAHILIHTGEKRFECEICQKKFTEKSTLTKHFRTHTGEKPYVCKVCQKGFAQVSHCKIHFRLHTGEKPYLCVICKRAFIGSTQLKNHLRSHTQEKPYVCDICQLGFQCKSGLNNHLPKHTGEKPYPCDKCTKRFPSKYKLRLHVCNVHAHDSRTPGSQSCSRKKCTPAFLTKNSDYRSIRPAPLVVTGQEAISFANMAQLGSINPVLQVTTKKIHRPRWKTRKPGNVNPAPQVPTNKIPIPRISTNRQTVGPCNILPVSQSSAPPATAPVFLFVTSQVPQLQVTLPFA